MLADDAFTPLMARLPPEGLAFFRPVRGVAYVMRPLNALTQERLAVFQGQYPHVVGIDIQQVEEVETRGILFHPYRNLTAFLRWKRC